MAVTLESLFVLFPWISKYLQDTFKSNYCLNLTAKRGKHCEQATSLQGRGTHNSRCIKWDCIFLQVTDNLQDDGLHFYSVSFLLVHEKWAFHGHPQGTIKIQFPSSLLFSLLKWLLFSSFPLSFFFFPQHVALALNKMQPAFSKK